MLIAFLLLAGAEAYDPGPAWELLGQAAKDSPPTLVEEPAAPTPGNLAKWYQVDEGVCVNGNPGYVYAYHEPADKGTNNNWVIQMGSPAPTLSWCIDEEHCAIFGVPTPFKPGTNETLLPGGPLNPNCTDNPDFCGFNMAVLAPECTMDLFMGNSEHAVNPNNSHTPYGNVSVLHFDGLKVLEKSIEKLLSLGMNKAEQVLLTGVAHGGTAVFLHADRIQAQIKKANPGLKKFKALPADGLHPKHFTVLYIGVGNYVDSWLTAALEALGTMTNAGGAYLPGCAKANPGKEWNCLYVNETLPYIQTNLFAVNQMASVWDSQCVLEGMSVNNILQMGCSVNNHYEREYRTCNQYPEYCVPEFVKNVTTPYQQQYIDDYARSGIPKKTGNGGFFHSCYLGAYFTSAWEGTGIWNIIAIDGLTMQQAISNWWNDEATPARKPTAQAAWTTDCTWDSTTPEPPKWSNATCDDWKDPGTNTSGCSPPGCKLYSQCPRPPWTNKYLCNPSCGGITVYY